MHVAVRFGGWRLRLPSRSRLAVASRLAVGGWRLAVAVGGWPLAVGVAVGGCGRRLALGSWRWRLAVGGLFSVAATVPLEHAGVNDQLIPPKRCVLINPRRSRHIIVRSRGLAVSGWRGRPSPNAHRSEGRCLRRQETTHVSRSYPGVLCSIRGRFREPQAAPLRRQGRSPPIALVLPPS